VTADCATPIEYAAFRVVEDPRKNSGHEDHAGNI
jgi:hypothetical protein